MLSRFRMTIEDATREYYRFANQVFARKKFLHQIRYKYPRKPLRKAIKDVIQRESESGDVEQSFRQYDCSDAEQTCLTYVLPNLV